MNENSFLFWYPILTTIKELNLPHTEIIPLQKSDISDIIILPHLFMEEKKELIEKLSTFTFPIFIKTDDYSAKHFWKSTCYVESKEQFIFNLQSLIKCAIQVHSDINAIILREFIPLQRAFHFFEGNTPIAKERRYFIANGNILCGHSYWDEEAFENLLTSDQKEKLHEINIQTEEEKKILIPMVTEIAKKFNGNWSVDFACDIHGKWYCIDMALAKDSWHPINCDKNMN